MQQMIIFNQMAERVPKVLAAEGRTFRGGVVVSPFPMIDVDGTVSVFFSANHLQQDPLLKEGSDVLFKHIFRGETTILFDDGAVFVH